MNNTEMVEQSMLLTRVSDLLKSVCSLKVPKEFTILRASSNYALKAFEHYTNGFSIVYFDAAMYLKYQIEVLKHKEQENLEYFSNVNGGEVDPCFGIAMEHLKVCADDALRKKIGKAAESDYMSAVRAYVEPYREHLEKQANDLWSKAEKSPDIVEDNWRNLANSLVERAVRDYEAALSGINQTKTSESPDDVKRSIEKFSKTDAGKYYDTLQIEDVLSKIKRTYFNEFVPLVDAHADEILTAWEKSQRRCDSITKPWKCPSCGGDLRRGIWTDARIECSYCNLSAPIPKDVYKKHRKEKI